MTIKVEDSQLHMLASVVRDQVLYVRHAPDAFYSTGYESSEWIDLYRVLRSIDKYWDKQYPKHYPHRRRRRLLKSLTRRLKEAAQEGRQFIKEPTRWEQLKYSFSTWLSK